MKAFGILVAACLMVMALSQISYEECKRDCTLDWVDGVHGCESIGNPQYCHQNCQKIVHGCLDECPRIVCIDECRAKLERCRKSGKGVCELQFNECEILCEDTYDHKEDI